MKIVIDVWSVFLASHPHTSLFQQKGGGGSWLGGLFSKFGRSSNNEMKLPDDKDPAVSHDCPFSFCLCFKGKLQLVLFYFIFLCVLFSSPFFFFFFFMCCFLLLFSFFSSSVFERKFASSSWNTWQVVSWHKTVTETIQGNSVTCCWSSHSFIFTGGWRGGVVQNHSGGDSVTVKITIYFINSHWD